METSSHKISEHSKVSRGEWQQVMPRYRLQQKEWTFIPNFIWVILIVLSIISIYYVQNLWSIAGVIVALYSAAQLGSRSGNIDGFQIGYEWGKENAIMQTYDITEEQLYEITKENSEIEYHANN